MKKKTNNPQFDEVFYFEVGISATNVTLRSFGRSVALKGLRQWLPAASMGPRTFPHPWEERPFGASLGLSWRVLPPKLSVFGVFLGGEVWGDLIVCCGILFFGCFPQSFLSTGGRLVSPEIVRGFGAKEEMHLSTESLWLPLRIVSHRNWVDGGHEGQSVQAGQLPQLKYEP